jgi:hypothetical protein
MPEVAVFGVVVVQADEVDASLGPAGDLGVGGPGVIAEREVAPAPIGLLDDAGQTKIVGKGIRALGDPDRLGRTQGLAEDADGGPVGRDTGGVAAAAGSSGEAGFPSGEVGGGGEVESFHVAVEEEEPDRRVMLVEQQGLSLAESGGGLLAAVGVVGGAGAESELVELAPQGGGAYAYR